MMFTSENPTCMPMMDPAICAASKMNATVIPSSNPTINSLATTPIVWPDLTCIAVPPYTGYNSAVNAIAKPALIWAGTAAPPGKGVNTSSADIRMPMDTTDSTSWDKSSTQFTKGRKSENNCSAKIIKRRNIQGIIRNSAPATTASLGTVDRVTSCSDVSTCATLINTL